MVIGSTSTGETGGDTSAPLFPDSVNPCFRVVGALGDEPRRCRQCNCWCLNTASPPGAAWSVKT